MERIVAIVSATAFPLSAASLAPLSAICSVCCPFSAFWVMDGIAAGYAAYQMLKRHVPPSEALRKAVTLEKDVA
jgi:hypothetical protein